jgi:hypothetical protein
MAYWASSHSDHGNRIIYEGENRNKKEIIGEIEKGFKARHANVYGIPNGFNF